MPALVTNTGRLAAGKVPDVVPDPAGTPIGEPSWWSPALKRPGPGSIACLAPALVPPR
jgi:hypothetical protein